MRGSSMCVTMFTPFTCTAVCHHHPTPEISCWETTRTVGASTIAEAGQVVEIRVLLALCVRRLGCGLPNAMVWW